MIDTHCHLTDRGFELGVEGVIGDAREAGVGGMITLGTNLADSQRAIEVADKFDGVYCAVGIHPEELEAGERSNGQTIRENLIEIAGREKVVAMGEIGLDYVKLGGREREKQIQLFRLQLGVASGAGLPIVVHNRGADEDVLRIVDEFKGRVTGVFHCFSQDERFLEEVLARDFYVGFAGNVTFEKNQPLRDVAILVPDDRILIETDAPYLMPEPYRGKWPNVPANVKIVLEFVAELKNISAIELEKIVDKNARRIFKRMTV